MIAWLTLVLLLPLISALPLRRRADPACGRFDTVPSGPYSLLTDVWGESSSTSGGQCSTFDSFDYKTNTVAWSTEWTWSNQDGVKSFANIQLNEGLDKQLDAIHSMPSTWKWSQNTNGYVVSDVTYDLFTSNSPGGAHLHEVMIWLANHNAQPISFQYDANGKASPIATNLPIAGHTWNLYMGSNGYNEVLSFLPTRGTIRAFKGDILGFFTYLIQNGHVSASEYLVTAQAGTEATSGSATFETSAYALAIESD